MQALAEHYFLKAVDLLRCYDTVLAVDIDHDATRFIRLRRTLRHYLLERTEILNLPKAQLHSANLRRFIESANLTATTTVVGLPETAGILEKRITVPHHASDDIEAYLLSGESKILPPGVDFKDIELRYQFVDVSDTGFDVQLLLYRNSHIAELQALAEELGPQQILYASFGQVNSGDETSMPVKPVNKLKMVSPDMQIDPVHDRALSLAISGFADPFNGASLLDDVARQAADQQIWKHLVMKSILTFGLVIICATLLLFIAQSLLNWQYQKYETAAEQVRPLIEARDSLNFVNRSVRKLHRSYADLTGKRSYMAFYIHEICRELPDGAWFHKVEATADIKTGKPGSILLHGFARQESRIAELLSRIENLPFADNIALDEMTVLNRKALWRQYKINEQRLVEFKVKLHVQI